MNSDQTLRELITELENLIITYDEEEDPCLAAFTDEELLNILQKAYNLGKDDLIEEFSKQGERQLK